MNSFAGHPKIAGALCDFVRFLTSATDQVLLEQLGLWAKEKGLDLVDPDIHGWSDPGDDSRTLADILDAILRSSIGEVRVALMGGTAGHLHRERGPERRTQDSSGPPDRRDGDRRCGTTRETASRCKCGYWFKADDRPVCPKCGPPQRDG